MNKDFIDIIREIRGSGQPGTAHTDGIWYELTMANKNGNPGIYGDILAKYGIFGDNGDLIQLIADNIGGIQAIANAINAGVDFSIVMTLIEDVAALEVAMPTKVDKVAGSSLISATALTKLTNIADEATKNQTDSYLLDRENHIGTQSADTLIDGIDNVVMTAIERIKLGTIAPGANNYIHPSKHPVTILDGGTNYNKVLKTDMAGVVGFGDVSWSEVGGKPVSFTPAVHEHSMDEITSGSITAARVIVSEGRQFITAEQATALLDMEVKSNKGIPLGYAPLDANGKINPSYINDLNLIEVFTPADLSSMLNLTSAQPGDIAYRLDTEDTYMLVALPVNVQANWKKLNSGAGVISVNGLTGAVSLSTANITEDVSAMYFTNERVDDRVAALLQAGTNVSLSYDDISGTLTISANDSSVDWSELQNRPTTVAGYKISDAYTKSEVYTKVETNTVVVHKTGDETIAGVKTFSSSPIVPTPTANTQAANKAYVDNEILQATSTEVYAGPYGLNWDETNDVYLRTGSTNYKAIQSLMRRCVMNANGTVNYYLHPHNSNYKEDGTAADLTGASGNVMVEVPKFYYKYNYNTTGGVVHEHSISLTQLDGYTVHDAFVRGGVEKDNRYYPAYLGYSTGSKLLSRSGVYPTVNQTRAQFRTLARANGAGWEQIDFLLHEAIALLMVIEYGTMNIQSALGQGRTALTGGTWVGGSLLGINGLSNGVGNGTANVTYAGSADDAAADGSFMTYRGCENFFGNVWRFVDGINCNGSNSKLVYLNMNPATYADSVITGDYVSIGVTSAAASGYARKLGNTRKGFIPTDTTGGTSANGTTDYYYTSTIVDTLALVGGAADNGLVAGPLNLYVYNAPSLSGVNVGAGVSR